MLHHNWLFLTVVTYDGRAKGTVPVYTLYYGLTSTDSLGSLNEVRI